MLWSHYPGRDFYPSTLTNGRFVEDMLLQSNRNCSLGSGVEPLRGFRVLKVLAF